MPAPCRPAAWITSLRCKLRHTVQTADDAAAQSLARDMIEVHGTEAATIARENARRAAVAAQQPQAKCWIRVLELVQRQLAKKDM